MSPLIDAGPAIADMASIVGEELLRCISVTLGVDMDCVMALRQKGQEEVLVVAFTQEGRDDTLAILETAQQRILTDIPDATSRRVI